ncbi:MAG TPA: transposase [Staphylococcus ureilyticus]|uniref:transposase n=1 Tax=Staphylococcus ureilyticus TaxID=94138 RepID=UPI001E05709F|nr:transposase [Staphylococcus ureilyticus]
MWNYYKENLSSDSYRCRKYDIEPVLGRMKRNFGVRTHLRGRKSIENDIVLVLMSMNLVKLAK